MKNPAPIFRQETLRSFSRDHHFALLLVWKIRQGLHNAIACQRISDYLVHVYQHDLVHHFLDEETFLFTRLDLTDELRKIAESDHAILKHLVSAIKRNGTDTALLHQFAIQLEKHIRFEERELYRHLQSVLPAKANHLLEKRAAKLTRETDLTWPDQFWAA